MGFRVWVSGFGLELRDSTAWDVARPLDIQGSSPVFLRCHAVWLMI